MVQKVSQTLTLKRFREIQWHRIFYMVYIEPVVFMLLFSITLSGKCQHQKLLLHKALNIYQHLGTIMRNQIIYQTCTVIFRYNVSDCKLLDDKNASAEIKVFTRTYLFSDCTTTKSLFSRQSKPNCSHMSLTYFSRARCSRALCLPFVASSLAPGRITTDASHCSSCP